MKKTLLALALLGCSATASAESLIYGGVDVGSSDLGGDSSTSYGVHVGTSLSMTPFLGLEAGYQDFGKFDSSNYDNTSGELKANTKYIALRPSLELGPLQVYAKAGLHDYEIESTSGSYNQSEVDGFYGLGAKYSIMGPLTIGASYNNFNFKNDDMKSFNVSIDFHFL